MELTKISKLVDNDWLNKCLAALVYLVTFSIRLKPDRNESNIGHTDHRTEAAKTRSFIVQELLVMFHHIMTIHKTNVI